MKHIRKHDKNVDILADKIHVEALRKMGMPNNPVEYHGKVLSDLVKRHFNGKDRINYIEIGVHEGVTCRHMMKQIPSIYVTGIDPLPKPLACETDRFKIIRLASDDAVNQLVKEYDFIYIDGDHSYDQCKKDYFNYRPLVIEGGIIGGHDYHETAHGVKKVVDELMASGVKVEFGEDLTWWIYV